MTDYLTLEEYKAKAMLLGMAYDARDHTFVVIVDHQYVSFDADTVTPLGDTMASFVKRIKDVQEGLLGPGWLTALSKEDREKIWGAERSRAHFT